MSPELRTEEGGADGTCSTRASDSADPVETDPDIVGPPLGRRRPRDVAGHRVYQRDGLIDPSLTDKRGRTALERMQRGIAPIGPDGEEINLHHLTQTERGPMAELVSTQHRENDRLLHIYSNQCDRTWRGESGIRHLCGSAPQSIDRGAFNR